MCECVGGGGGGGGGGGREREGEDGVEGNATAHLLFSIQCLYKLKS